MTSANILKIWANFRESEVKKEEGSISKDYFIREMETVFKDFTQRWRDTATKIYEHVFSRFQFSKKDSIDLYDFLVSMSVCSRMDSREKINCRRILTRQ